MQAKYGLFLDNVAMQGIAKISHYQPKAYIKIRVAKWLKKLAEEQKNFNDTRNDLIKKYADKDDKGKPVVENNNFKFSGENKDKIEKEIEKLREVEFDLPEMRASWIAEPLTCNELTSILDIVVDDIKEDSDDD